MIYCVQTQISPGGTAIPQGAAIGKDPMTEQSISAKTTHSERAREMYGERAAERLEPGRYRSYTADARRYYLIDLDCETCTCPDRVRPCKHLLAAELLESEHRKTSVDEAIRRDARQHPERTYCQHIEAAQRIAAEEYRAETRRLADEDMLDAVYTGLERAK